MDLLLIVLELILVDIVFGGDNAIVIAMATKKLEPSLKKKAAVIGAILAITLRVFFVSALLIVEEIHIEFINIIGGAFLLYIALTLINQNEGEHKIQTEKTLSKAIRTIVLADVVMSLDNVMVIAIIAQKAPVNIEGKILLVIFALLISFPIILMGASLLSKLIEKIKVIIYVMAFLLIHVALETIIKDPVLSNIQEHINERLETYIIWSIAAIILFTKLYIDYRKTKKKEELKSNTEEENSKS